MRKKLIIWFGCTVIWGLIPVMVRYIISDITNVPFVFPEMSSELLFFNAILSADGLKELLLLERHKYVNLKLLLGLPLIMSVLIMGIICGVLQTSDYMTISLSIDSLKGYSIFFTVCSLIICFFIQLLGGGNTNER